MVGILTYATPAAVFRATSVLMGSYSNSAFRTNLKGTGGGVYLMQMASLQRRSRQCLFQEEEGHFFSFFHHLSMSANLRYTIAISEARLLLNCTAALFPCTRSQLCCVSREPDPQADPLCRGFSLEGTAASPAVRAVFPLRITA